MCPCGQPLDKRRRRWCSQTCKNKFTVATWRRNLKRKAVEYMGGRCQNCGYDKCDAAMTFHHLHSKRFGIAQEGQSRSWKRVREELDKCRLLCLNCHAETHAEEHSRVVPK